MANIIIGKVAPLFQGEYNSVITYNRLDIVSYLGSSYVCLTDNVSGVVPTNTTFWRLVASKGDKGVDDKYLVGTVSIEEIDSMGTNWALYVNESTNNRPAFYKLVNGSRIVGTLFVFSDFSSHVLTQVLFTHQTDLNTKGWNSHADNKIFSYYRSYNISASNLDVERGKWTEWKEIGKDWSIEINEIENKMFKAIEGTKTYKDF